MEKFSQVEIGDTFYIVEDGAFLYEKVSATEAVLLENSVITEFDLDYVVAG